MSKINENQIKSLFLSVVEAKEKGESLGKVFERTAKKHGMAKGSVRNVYYSALKKAEVDGEYKKLMLGEKNLSANKIVEFDKEESRALLKTILTGVTFGKSVRRVIAENTSDEKTALRYQNKYRNLLKYDKKTVESIREEIKEDYGRCYNPYEGKILEDFNITKIKREINALYDRIAQRVREENLELKEKLKYFERENERLKILVEERENSPINKYFSNKELVAQKRTKTNK
ncbi:MAG: hypothetical protein E7360_04930 [Clostridiales bacterium]|nr:hypothetical protein [Clostridiales bacterium]